MTMRSQLRTLIAFAFLISAVPVAGLQEASAEEPGKLVLGLCQSTATGPAKFATALWKGAELARLQHEQAKGENTPSIDIVAMDIANNDPAQARLSIRKAIQVHGVSAILCWGTNVMVQNGPLVDENRVLAFTMSQGTGVVKNSRYIQQLEGVTTLQCRTAARFVQEHYPDVKRLGVLYVNYEYGRELKAMCETEFARIGVEMVGAEAHPKSPPDLRAQLTKILSASPDAIYHGAIGGGSVALAIRTGRELGYDGLFMTHGAGDTPDVYDLKLAEKGFFYVSHALPDDAPAQIVELVDEYGGYVGAGFDFVWVAANLAKQLVDAGENIDGAALIKKLRTHGGIETPINSYVFMADGNTTRGLGVFGVSDGRRKLLKNYNADDLQ